MKGKRSVSKPKEPAVKSSPLLNKSGLGKAPNKDIQPILSKNALDLIDKISDERFKNIKNQMEKETKKSSVKVMNNFVGKNGSVLRKNEEIFVNSKNHNDNCKMPVKNKNEKNPDNNSKKNYSKEDYEKFVKRIQRWFKRILKVKTLFKIKKRKSDPQYEMKMLLKRKKLSILRNYNIKSNMDTSGDHLTSYSKIEDDFQLKISDNNEKKKNIENCKNAAQQNSRNLEENSRKLTNSYVTENKETAFKINKMSEIESRRLKNSTDDESSKRNNKEIVSKKTETVGVKSIRSEAYDERPKSTLRIEELEGQSKICLERDQEKKIQDKIEKKEEKKKENFDFTNNNSIVKELSELGIHNEVFTPSSNFNLNFNENSKNFFSPLKNVVHHEDKVNYYNPMFTQQNNSIDEDMKEIVKSSMSSEKINPIEENGKRGKIVSEKENKENVIKNFQTSNISNHNLSNKNLINESLQIENKNLNNNNFTNNNHSNNLSNEPKIDFSEPKQNKTDTLNITNLSQNNQNSNNSNRISSSNIDENNLLSHKFQIPDDKSHISSATNEKINQILSYLDDTQKNYSPKHKEREKISHKLTAPYTSSYQPGARETTAEILSMRLEHKELLKTNEALKEVIEQQKQLIKQKDEYYRNQHETFLKKANQDVAAIIQEKDLIIDNLVAEKRALVNELENIKDEVNKIEASYNKKIAALNDNFEVERRKDKDAWYVAEKARRKKWEETRMKEIKEMTIKGLEPEIERILQNHKQEMLKWEENTNDELRKQKERLNKEFERRLTEQREKIMKEKEEAIEHERSLFQQRARNQSERFEDEYAEERRRWNVNLQAEISKVEALREKDRKSHEEELKQLEEKYTKLLEEKEEYYKAKVAETEKRNSERMALEVESVKFRVGKEKEAFIEEKQREFDQKYANMKSEIMKDKEKQIELIIQKLGDETISERRKMQVELENKAEERNKVLKIENEQMRNKIVELNDKLSGETKVRIMLDDNLNILSKRIIDFEHESARKDKKILELTSSLNEFKDKYSNVAKDFQKEKMGLETDFQIKIDKHINEMKIMTEKYESLKNYYENKLQEMKNFHDSQINMLDSRVKKKLDSKEEIIKKLQEDIEFKNITIQKYEEMLNRQRKELLFSG